MIYKRNLTKRKILIKIKIKNIKFKNLKFEIWIPIDVYEFLI